MADWNIPVSFQNPFLVKAEPYILLADKGGNTLMLFNASGKVRDFTVRILWCRPAYPSREPLRSFFREREVTLSRCTI